VQRRKVNVIALAACQFQSPPTPKGRCNEADEADEAEAEIVSIPTHPEGQVQLQKWPEISLKLTSIPADPSLCHSLLL